MTAGRTCASPAVFCRLCGSAAAAGGRTAADAAVHAVEGAYTLKPALHGDLGQCARALGDECVGSVVAVLVQQGIEVHAERLAEDAGQVMIGVTERRRHRFQGDVLAVVGLYVVQNPPRQLGIARPRRKVRAFGKLGAYGVQARFEAERVRDRHGEALFWR